MGAARPEIVPGGRIQLDEKVVEFKRAKRPRLNTTVSRATFTALEQTRSGGRYIDHLVETQGRLFSESLMWLYREGWRAPDLYGACEALWDLDPHAPIDKAVQAMHASARAAEEFGVDPARWHLRCENLRRFPTTLWHLRIVVGEFSAGNSVAIDAIAALGS